MKLLTKELEAKIPKFGGSEGTLDPIAYVKLFTPWSNWTWYICEYDPEDKICFGYVEGFENEFGDFSLTELEEITGPMGLRIERDLYFEPQRISEIKRSKS